MSKAELVARVLRSQRTAAANCPNHTGVTQAIRDALAQAGEPLSVYKIHLATGIAPEKIRGMLSQMVNRTGGVMSLPGPRGTVAYTLYSTARSASPKDGGSGKIAGRIEYPGYVYGASRLG